MIQVFTVFANDIALLSADVTFDLMICSVLKNGAAEFSAEEFPPVPPFDGVFCAAEFTDCCAEF